MVPEYEAELAKFEQIEFPILKVIEQCNRQVDPAAALRYYIEASDRMAAQAGQGSSSAPGGGS